MTSFCGKCLTWLGEIEEWLKKNGMWLENMCKRWNRSTKYRKQVGLIWSLALPLCTVVAMGMGFREKLHLQWTWFIVPTIVPLVVFTVGWCSIDDVQESDVVKRHNIVVDVLFFLLSVGVSLAIGMTGLSRLILVILGCVFIIWASIVEMVFNFATPMGLVGIAVSGTISVTLNACKGQCKALVCIPVVLGVLVILLSWRFKTHIFEYDPTAFPEQSPLPPTLEELGLLKPPSRIYTDRGFPRSRYQPRMSTGSLVDGNFNPGASMNV